MPLWDVYYISNAMQDTNTVQEKSTLVMCDTNTFSFVMQLTYVDLQIS